MHKLRVKLCRSGVNPKPPRRPLALGRAWPSIGDLKARNSGDDNDIEMQQRGRRAENGQQVADLLQQCVHILKGGAPGGSTPVHVPPAVAPHEKGKAAAIAGF